MICCYVDVLRWWRWYCYMRYPGCAELYGEVGVLRVSWMYEWVSGD